MFFTEFMLNYLQITCRLRGGGGEGSRRKSSSVLKAVILWFHRKAPTALWSSSHDLVWGLGTPLRRNVAYLSFNFAVPWCCSQGGHPTVLLNGRDVCCSSPWCQRRQCRAVQHKQGAGREEVQRTFSSWSKGLIWDRDWAVCKEDIKQPKVVFFFLFTDAVVSHDMSADLGGCFAGWFNPDIAFAIMTSIVSSISVGV